LTLKKGKSTGDQAILKEKKKSGDCPFSDSPQLRSYSSVEGVYKTQKKGTTICKGGKKMGLYSQKFRAPTSNVQVKGVFSAAERPIGREEEPMIILKHHLRHQKMDKGLPLSGTLEKPRRSSLEYQFGSAVKEGPETDLRVTRGKGGYSVVKSMTKAAESNNKQSPNITRLEKSQQPLRTVL